MPDFNIDTLARYLHLNPQQISKLADRGKLPGRKVGGEWRFARADVHHWLEEKIGVSDEIELVEMEGVLQRSASGAEQDISIVEMLPREAIAVPLVARTRNSVFTSMVALAEQTGWLWDSEKMIEAIRSREEMFPTALENGVALLHPRRPMAGILAQGFLALGISPGGIPFGGNRGALTDVFFLICSMEDRGHLRTLARLSRVLGYPGFLDTLRAAPDAMAARELIAETEAKLAS